MSISAKNLTKRFGAASVVSGHIRGQTNTLPLCVEILYNGRVGRQSRADHADRHGRARGNVAGAISISGAAPGSAGVRHDQGAESLPRCPARQALTHGWLVRFFG
jgi:hypothetical protein